MSAQFMKKLQIRTVDAKCFAFVTGDGSRARKLTLHRGVDLDLPLVDIFPQCKRVKEDPACSETLLKRQRTKKKSIA